MSNILSLSLEESLKSNTLEGLKNICRVFNISGFASLKKAELVIHVKSYFISSEFKNQFLEVLNDSMIIMLYLILTNKKNIEYLELKKNLRLIVPILHLILH